MPRASTVRTLELGSMAEGVNAVTWDGKADDGAAVPAGNYSFSVVATNDGAAVEATALTFAQVAAVKQGAERGHAGAGQRPQHRPRRRAHVPLNRSPFGRRAGVAGRSSIA